ncbi:MAG: hypothetical protein A2X86_21580 [Bdellovibrionales bacterium GWA2_49_15]|nr:MAG: hypothetical protein A2X86_21580 [Bdellovibrionales bacterium GWA2_49_15]
MKILTIGCVVVLLISCSFKSRQGGNDPVGGDSGGGGRIASLSFGFQQNGDMGGGLVKTPI